jgi:penicillin amidase
VPGWDATYDWKGWLDFAQLPQVKNPPAGAIGTANARIVPPDFPALLTWDWDAPFRQQRVDALVVARQGHDVASMKAAQADVLSPAIERLQTLMIAIAQASPGVDDKVLDQLTAWDGRQTLGSTESLIFAAWMREATRGIFADDLGPAFQRYFDSRPQALIRLLEGKATARDWCDDRRTPTRETCAQVLAESLARALKDLETQLGPDRTTWRWGDVHAAVNEHRPFGMVAALAPFFNVEVPSAGGDETLNRGKSDWGSARPFANRHASSLRAIYDFADLERSLFMLPTGQSGNPISRHYRDFAARWAAVDYIEIPTSPEAIARTATGTWTLTPVK